MKYRESSSQVSRVAAIIALALAGGRQTEARLCVTRQPLVTGAVSEAGPPLRPFQRPQAGVAVGLTHQALFTGPIAEAWMTLVPIARRKDRDVVGGDRTTGDGDQRDGS